MLTVYPRTNGPYVGFVDREGDRYRGGPLPVRSPWYILDRAPAVEIRHQLSATVDRLLTNDDVMRAANACIDARGVSASGSDPGVIAVSTIEEIQDGKFVARTFGTGDDLPLTAVELMAILVASKVI